MKIVLLQPKGAEAEAKAVRTIVAAELPVVSITSELAALERWEAAVVMLPWKRGVDPQADELIAARDAYEAGFTVLLVLATLDEYQPASLPMELRWLQHLKATGADDPAAVVGGIEHALGLYDATSKVQVFISYSWGDGQELAGQIREGLEAKGISCFQDARDLPRGESVQPSLEKEIGERGLLLVIDTPASRKSRWVVEEIVSARAQRCPVIAVGAGSKGLPGAVGDVPYLTATEVDDAVLDKIEVMVRRARGLRNGFTDRVVRTARVVGRALGFDSRARGTTGIGLHKQDIRVWVEANPKLPEGIAMAQAAEQTRDRGDTSCLMVAGEVPYPRVVRTVVQGMSGALKPPVRACPLPSVATALAGLGAGASFPRVFLSASMPEDEALGDPAAANNLLFSFVSALGPALAQGGGRLVFGGHPSITPVVHEAMTLAQIPGGPHIELHLSRVFEDRADPCISDREIFGEVHWHGPHRPADVDFFTHLKAQLATDLTAMRQVMAARSEVAILLGGRSAGTGATAIAGLIEEHNIFRAAHPDASIHLVTMLGGVTGALATELGPGAPATTVHKGRDVDLIVGRILASMVD